MADTLLTQGATIRTIAHDPARDRVILFSSDGVDIYRTSDWTRVAWAAIANVTCGCVNDNGIYIGTSDTGIYKLPHAVGDCANGDLTQVFGATAPITLESYDIKAIATNGQAMAIATAAECIFTPDGITAYDYDGSGIVACALSDNCLALANTQNVYIFAGHPTSHWSLTTAQTTTADIANRLVFEIGTNNLLICHENGLRLIDCSSPGGSGGLSTNGLVAHWTFDAASGTTVYEENGKYNGTLANGATAGTQDGRLGKALALDGTNDCMTFGTLGIFGGAFTAAAWVNFDRAYTSLSAAEQILCITGEKNIALVRDNATGKFRFYGFNGTVFGVYSQTIPTPGVDYFVAVRWDMGTKMEILVNGAVEATLDTASIPTALTNTNTIGGRYTEADRYLDGWIDDVRFYSRLLTDDEIASLYSQDDTDAPRPGLVLHYTMNAISGTTIYDEIGTKNGTINGAVQTEGKVGKALSFDGNNDYVEIPYVAALQPTKITISAWAYRDDWSIIPTAETEKIVSSTQSGGYALGIGTGGKLTTFFYANAVYQSALADHTGLAPGWHLITATYDGRYAKIYVDGVLINTVDAGANYNITYSYSNSLIIGGEARTGVGCSSNFWEGRIESVRIYNRAISQEEVAGIFAETKPAMPKAGLLAHWSMDSINGSSLLEESGLYPATITAATQVAGKIGKALDFNGTTAFAEVPHASALKPTAGLSYLGWAYLEDWSSAGNTRIISCTQTGGWNLEFDLSAVGELSASIRISGTYYRAIFNYTSLDPGWHFFVATCDGRYVRLYVDTVLVATADKGRTGAIDYTYNNSIIIGGDAGDTTGCAGNYWGGALDGIRIYNRAISQEEINILFIEGAGGVGTLDYTSEIGEIPNCEDAIKIGDCIAYGTSNGSDGGRFGILQLDEDGAATEKTTVTGTDSGAVWISAGITDAIHDNTHERYRMIAEVVPGANAREVRRDWALYTEITDAFGGIQAGTVALKVNDQVVNPTTSAITNGFAIAYVPGASSGYAERITVELSGTDADGNTVSRTWWFVTASAPAATVTDTTPPNVVCTRDIGLADSEADEQVNNVPVIWLDDITGPLIVTDAQAVAVGTVAIDGVTYHRHTRSVRVDPTDSESLQTRDLRKGQIITMTCPAIGMTAKKCEVLACQRNLDDTDDITYDLQVAYYEAVS